MLDVPVHHWIMLAGAFRELHDLKRFAIRHLSTLGHGSAKRKEYRKPRKITYYTRADESPLTVENALDKFVAA